MITLDWDYELMEETLNKKLKEVSQYFFDVQNIKIYYRLSANKHFHIKILGVENDYIDRFILGDDKKRIMIDQQREKLGYPINILFDRKTYPDGEIKKAGAWQQWKNQ